MLIIKSLPFLRQNIRRILQKGKRIALVPTMGNLHNGHMKLIDEAKSHADVVVVSIFINPLQFDNDEDLVRYPRTLQKDYKKLNNRHVDFVFSPNIKDIYSNGIKKTTYVEVPEISTIVEEHSRAKHYRGVSTIICKLFNLVKPNVACFGEKDYQQLMLIRKIILDLNYDINVVSVPIVRAMDGLALSSRNSYLTKQERKVAPTLSKVMNIMAINLKEGILRTEEIISFARNELTKHKFRIDSIQIRDADTLSKLSETSKRAVILIAAWLGKARLIDNQVIELN